MNIKVFYPPKPTSSGCRPPSVLFTQLCNNKDYVIEKKKDGYAMIVYFTEEGVEYYGRHGSRLDVSMIPMSMRELENQDIPVGTILGGEAIGARTKNIKDKIAFYTIYKYKNRWVNDKSLKDNKILLKKVVTPTKRLEVVDYFHQNDIGSFEDYYFDVTKSEDVEGVILKDVTRPIKIGLHSCPVLPYWVKFKMVGR